MSSITPYISPRDLFLFDGLPDSEVSLLLSVLPPPVAFADGKRIDRSPAFRHALGVLLQGSVTVRSHTHQSVPLLMSRLSAGSLFGVVSLFSDEEEYISELTACGTVTVLFIPQDVFSDILRRYPIVSENYIRFLSDRIRFLNQKLALLTEGSTEQRLYYYLSAHSNAQGTVQLSDSMADVAKFLHMGRSSLYRSLDTLTENGLIQKDGKQITLLPGI